jgi:hypothetical protein
VAALPLVGKVSTVPTEWYAGWSPESGLLGLGEEVNNNALYYRFFHSVLWFKAVVFNLGYVKLKQNKHKTSSIISLTSQKHIN